MHKNVGYSIEFYKVFALLSAAKQDLANVHQYKCLTVAQNMIKLS